jgi:hypothetical protein
MFRREKKVDNFELLLAKLSWIVQYYLVQANYIYQKDQGDFHLTLVC